MRSSSQGRPAGALVLGANRRALSVVRSLGRRGIETWVMRADEQSVAVHSRYVSRSMALTRERQAAVAQLLEVADRHRLRDWCLLPTDDDDVALLAEHHRELSACFRLGAPPVSAVRWALDKRRTYALAAQCGIPFPATAEADASDGLAFPLIVKPAFRPRPLANSTPKAWRADDPQELARIIGTAAALMPAERLMLQELVPGGGEHQLAYGALCRDGEVLASLAVKRLRQWPLDFGMASTFVRTIDEREVAALAQPLLRAARFTGLIELEFKRDPRCGTPLLLDANPRPWGWISICPAAGVDFAYLLWRMLQGDTVGRMHGRPGVAWVRLAADLPAAAAQVRAGELSLRRYLSSLRPPLATAIYAPDDPLPAFLDAPLTLAIGARRRLGRAKPAAAPTGQPLRRSGSSSRGRTLLIVENAPVPQDRRVWQEALALRRAGWEVEVIAPQRWGAPRAPKDETLEGVRIRRFPLRPAEARRLGHLGEYVTALWRIWRLAHRAAHPHPFDVIHVSNPPDFLFLATLGQRRRGTRLIFDHHDLSPELYASRGDGTRAIVRRALLAFERLAVARADVVLATNESGRRIAMARDRKPSEDVFVVRNGPMLERFTPVPRDRSLARGRRYLLAYVGLMGPQDGVEHGIHALAHLHRRRQDFHALFVGDGEMRPQLERLAERLGVGAHVEFAGLRGDADVRRAICSADVCLAPDPRTDYADHCTLVKIAEYMALSRPTVGYDLTESKVTAGGAALFATGDDPSELADRIDELLRDEALRLSLGVVGRARVERELAWEHSEPALLKAYERAACQPLGRERGERRSDPGAGRR